MIKTFLKRHLVLCITLGAVALACLVLLIFRGAGLYLYAVQSGSMEPTIPIYSMCLVTTHVDYDELEVGDIIVYTRDYDGTKIIHRVYEITDDGIITKGDANPMTDGVSVTPENLYARYIAHVPYVAYVYNFVRSPVGVVAVILILLALLVLEAVEAARRKGR